MKVIMSVFNFPFESLNYTGLVLLCRVGNHLEMLESAGKKKLFDCVTKVQEGKNSCVKPVNSHQEISR